MYIGDGFKVGNNVTTKPTGDVLIESGASVVIDSTGDVYLNAGFTCKSGARFQILKKCVYLPLQ